MRVASSHGKLLSVKTTTLLPLAASLLLPIAACGDANEPSSGDEAGQTDACSYPSSGDAARPVEPPPTTNINDSGTSTATLSLTAGDVQITLNRAAAPCTVNSFESLASQGYFDDTACHRLTDTGIFVLQCGDPSETGMGGPGYSFADETDDSMTYPAGTVAMANAGPDTNGSQFFLVWDDTDLPPDYTVFATMDQAGLDVVADIAAESVEPGDSERPIAEAQITSVSLG